MDIIDLNFLKEGEVEAIVSVIEKDFEVKAAEKARICRLRKQLISKDHKAELLSQSPFEGAFCVLCCSKFFIIVNPRQICSSCGMNICKSCCIFIKKVDQVICAICQSQQDLMAMNCTWFYEPIRRKFMEGGSQIVANSLSEYPKKNAISAYILNMVKGAQITKFRYHIEDASNNILDSLRKVESSETDENIKADKYTELIKKYSDKLKTIIRNTMQVIHVTLENYNEKTGIGNQKIDNHVSRILHDEVELLVGKKINMKTMQEKFKMVNGNSGGSQNSLESILASAIVEKLVYDHQQFLLETKDLKYDDLNIVLKDMVKVEHMDFDYDSVSQVPSRQGTVRKPPIFPVIPEPVKEVSPVESDSSSKFYSLSGVEERGPVVLKKWNEIQQTNNIDNDEDANSDGKPDIPIRSKRSSGLYRNSEYEDPMKVDPDVLVMPTVKKGESNWLMNAREPMASFRSITGEEYNNNSISSSIKRKDSKDRVDSKRKEDRNERPNSMFTQKALYGSMSNIHFQSDDPYIASHKNKVKRNSNIRPPSHRHLDDEFDEIFQLNNRALGDSRKDGIDLEYEKNLLIAQGIPRRTQGRGSIERNVSQDSGVVSQFSMSNAESAKVKSKRPEPQKSSKIPVGSKVKITKPRIVSKPNDKNDSDSSIDDRKTTSTITKKSANKGKVKLAEI